MEGDGHDAVSGVEGFLYAVTMVNVNVYVENTLVVPVVDEIHVHVRVRVGLEVKKHKTMMQFLQTLHALDNQAFPRLT